jgi:DNA helicase-2/ATP-dependent DNA helicase PcrA
LRQYHEEASDEAFARAENILEMHGAVKEYMVNNPEADIVDFLENIALVMDVDEYEETTNAVTLLTLHSAKGLEFPVVFMPGMEEGLCPHSRSFNDDMALEEERRLCYVGITRAMDRLFMTYAMSRALFGSVTHNMPSRFLSELPEPVSRNDVSMGVVSPYATIEKKAKKAERKDPVFDFARAPRWEAGTGGTDIEEGSEVIHPRFGEGKVTMIVGEGAAATADIDFGSEGIKRIALKYAKLEIRR